MVGSTGQWDLLECKPQYFGNSEYCCSYNSCIKTKVEEQPYTSVFHLLPLLHHQISQHRGPRGSQRDPVMVNFMCQLSWVMVPKYLIHQNIILDVSVRVFLDEINIKWMDFE